MANLQGWHLIIILVVILLLFGAAKLPALAKSMGQSARVFKGEMKAMKDEDESSAAPTKITAAESTAEEAPRAADAGTGTDRPTP